MAERLPTDAAPQQLQHRSPLPSPLSCPPPSPTNNSINSNGGGGSDVSSSRPAITGGEFGPVLLQFLLQELSATAPAGRPVSSAPSPVLHAPSPPSSPRTPTDSPRLPPALLGLRDVLREAALPAATPTEDVVADSAQYLWRLQRLLTRAVCQRQAQEWGLEGLAAPPPLSLATEKGRPLPRPRASTGTSASSVSPLSAASNAPPPTLPTELVARADLVAALQAYLYECVGALDGVVSAQGEQQGGFCGVLTHEGAQRLEQDYVVGLVRVLEATLAAGPGGTPFARELEDVLERLGRASTAVAELPSCVLEVSSPLRGPPPMPWSDHDASGVLSQVAQQVWCYQRILAGRFPAYRTWGYLERVQYFVTPTHSPSPTEPRASLATQYSPSVPAPAPRSPTPRGEEDSLLSPPATPDGAGPPCVVHTQTKAPRPPSPLRSPNREPSPSSDCGWQPAAEGDGAGPQQTPPSADAVLCGLLSKLPPSGLYEQVRAALGGLHAGSERSSPAPLEVAEGPITCSPMRGRQAHSGGREGPAAAQQQQHRPPARHRHSDGGGGTAAAAVESPPPPLLPRLLNLSCSRSCGSVAHSADLSPSPHRPPLHPWQAPVFSATEQQVHH